MTASSARQSAPRSAVVAASSSWITVWQDDQGRIVREWIVAPTHEIEGTEFVYPAP